MDGTVVATTLAASVCAVTTCDDNTPRTPVEWAACVVCGASPSQCVADAARGATLTPTRLVYRRTRSAVVDDSRAVYGVGCVLR